MYFFLSQIGDRILQIDDIDLSGSSHERAVDVIRHAGQNISLLVQGFKTKVSIQKKNYMSFYKILCY